MIHIYLRIYTYLYIGDVLRKNTGTTATATLAPQVTDISPTTAPTTPPSIPSTGSKIRVRSAIVMLITIGLFHVGL
jgi:hypothetical protein